MKQTIGERLKSVIKQNGFTNKSFAEELGVAPNYISMIINGKKALSDSLKLNITKVIPELNLDWLETGQGNIWQPSPSDIYLEKQGVKFSLGEAINLVASHPGEAERHPILRNMIDIRAIKLLKASRKGDTFDLDTFFENIS